MGFIAMNRFKVRHGSESDFEAIWANRKSRLNELKGFREFRFLKGPDSEEYRLYSSHVIWDSKEDFDAWINSDQFKDSHKGSKNKGAQGALMGPPEFEFFETILDK